MKNMKKISQKLKKEAVRLLEIFLNDSSNNSLQPIPVRVSSKK